jgi:Spy/CpxP family protein refolding chaperone
MTLTGQAKAKIWLVLVAVFVLGAVTGGALTGLYRSRASGNAGREGRERAMKDRFEKMRQELNLTDQQTTQVRAILDETRNEYKTLREELRPRFDEPRLKARAKIRALLNPDQQKKFDTLVAQQDAEHNAREADNGKR